MSSSRNQAQEYACTKAARPLPIGVIPTPKATIIYPTIIVDISAANRALLGGTFQKILLVRVTNLVRWPDTIGLSKTSESVAKLHVEQAETQFDEKQRLPL